MGQSKKRFVPLVPLPVKQANNAPSISPAGTRLVAATNQQQSRPTYSQALVSSMGTSMANNTHWSNYFCTDSIVAASFPPLEPSFNVKSGSENIPKMKRSDDPKTKESKTQLKGSSSRSQDRQPLDPMPNGLSREAQHKQQCNDQEGEIPTQVTIDKVQSLRSETESQEWISVKAKNRTSPPKQESEVGMPVYKEHFITDRSKNIPVMKARPHPSFSVKPNGRLDGTNLSQDQSAS